VGDDIIAEANIAGVAVFAAVAGQATVAVVGQDDRKDGFAALDHFFSFGADHHIVLDDGGAGELESGRALDIDETGAAAGVRFEAIDVAEVGDVNPVVFEHFDERCARWCFDDLAVDGE
jgi:hypothetical protein